MTAPASVKIVLLVLLASIATLVAEGVRSVKSAAATAPIANRSEADPFTRDGVSTLVPIGASVRSAPDETQPPTAAPLSQSRTAPSRNVFFAWLCLTTIPLLSIGVALALKRHFDTLSRKRRPPRS